MKLKAALLIALMTLFPVVQAAGTQNVTTGSPYNSANFDVTVTSGASCVLTTTDITVPGIYYANDATALTHTANNAITVACSPNAKYELTGTASLGLHNGLNTSSLNANLTYTFPATTITSTGSTDYYDVTVEVPTGQSTALPEAHTGTATITINLIQ